MEAATAANVGAVSSEIKIMTDAAAGSESYINSNNIIIEDTVASSSNNQEKDFELMDSVYSAAADGDIKKFEDHSNCLDQILTPNGNTILHIHITARRQPRLKISQNMDFVRKILEMCPDLLRKANKKGETLLHMAARHGHADVAKYLLQECKKQYQNDPELGIKNTRQMLQMINEAKDTALHEAVRYNHIDVVKVLLTVEDPELHYDANNAGETPLYLAAERGYADVLQEILSTCISPVDHGPCSRTALHATVIRNDIGTTKLLLNDKRILKSERDEQGWTPLHLAAHLGYIVILKMLLIKDRSAAYKVDNEGKTALHVAAGLGRIGVMQELISRCPGCCELVDNRGWNVLHFASTSKNRKAVGLILQNPLLGNLVNEKDKNGNTPFLHAASMRFIINHPKVDVQVFNNDNQNAVDKIDKLSFSLWNSFLDICVWSYLASFRIRNGRRLMSKDDHREGKENRGDPVSSNSNNVEVGKNHLVVATLIATVTFAAGFTVPGGFVADEGTDQGTAILTKNRAFQAFVILNTMSMFLSSLAVFNHLSRRPATHKTEIYRQMMFRILLINYAMVAMIGAFLAGTCAVLHNDKILAISSCLVPVAVYVYFLRISKPDPRYLR